MTISTGWTLGIKSTENEAVAKKIPEKNAIPTPRHGMDITLAMITSLLDGVTDIPNWIC